MATDRAIQWGSVCYQTLLAGVIFGLQISKPIAQWADEVVKTSPFRIHGSESQDGVAARSERQRSIATLVAVFGPNRILQQ